MDDRTDVPTTPLLETRRLSLFAGSRCLVRDLDWRVEPGQRWCVIGRNGAGKSTLLRALAGLPVGRSEGEVLWQGRAQATWRADAAAAHRALMGQQAADRFSISVRRLLDLSVAVPGRHDVLAVLAALDAAHLVDADASRLSGGERQRISLAQCILQGAPLMMLDEPVSFQDPAHQAVVARRLVQGDGSQTARASDAFVIAAHDVNWIARVATHVLALSGDGSWRAGPSTRILDTAVLTDVYGCGWESIGGMFVPLG